jgi:WXG100 family type VII secretion target
MATLKLDTDLARHVHSTMASTYGEFRNNVNTVNASARNLLEGNWEGNSAIEFRDQFDSWYQQVNTNLQMLQELADRLNREIGEWEAAAQRLGG